MPVRAIAAFSILLLLSQPLPAQELDVPLAGEAEKSPLWELGVGGGGTYTPDYPGADQSHLWGIPFPYAIYRGEILHSDRRGAARARWVKSVGYEFNVSAGGGLPSSSGENSAREGMPNLEWLGEIGPRLMIDLFTHGENRLLRLGIPVRAAFSSNFEHVTDRGFLFAPELLYDTPNLWNSGIDAYSLLTVNFAESRFGNYFYGVNPAYATPSRPAFAAKPGYLLTDLTLGLTAPLGSDLKVSLNSSLQFLHGAANEGSPLFRSSFGSSVSLVIIWVFARSDEKVVTED